MNGVRWVQAEQRFEGRCDACGDWYELSADSRHEFWPVDGRGLRICRACDRLRTAARRALERTESPSRVERDRGYSRAYHASLSPAERRALRRTDPEAVERQRRYSREWNRRRRSGLT